jgi:hypothetical protein
MLDIRESAETIEAKSSSRAEQPGIRSSRSKLMNKPKVLIGDAQCIDVREWERAKLLVPGKWFVYERQTSELSVISINVEVRADLVILRYQTRRPGDSSRQRFDIQVRAGLGFSPCNYTGRRPWFICPMPECERRVALLYLHGMNFMCRDCAGLSYGCRQLDRPNRAILHAGKIRMKLGGSPTVTDPFPPRPKGMHRTTYARLNAKVVELGLNWDPARIGRAAKKTSPGGR